MAQPISIIASGMVTAVGFTAAASCAAIRCALQNVTETGFIEGGGEPVLGAQVPFDEPWRGLGRLVRIITPAISECLPYLDRTPTTQVPLLLCVAEKTRPGRLDGLDDELLPEIEKTLGVHFHPKSVLLPQGRAAGALALQHARELIETDKVPFCIVAGVDSYLYGTTVAAYEERRRLLTSENSDGFIPGEAGAAVLVCPPRETKGIDLQCLGLGIGEEKATIESEEPLRADGLTDAINAALAEAGCTLHEIGYRICDANGEQYSFKEATLGLTRALRQKRDEVDLWHPADCIGEVGAAIGPSVFAVALAAARKGYAPGPQPLVLAHFGSDDGARAAVILKPFSGELK